MKLAGLDFNERDLLRRYFMQMRPVKSVGYGLQRWVKVMRAFGVGSTVAYAMCRELGFNPEDQVRK